MRKTETSVITAMIAAAAAVGAAIYVLSPRRPRRSAIVPDEHRSVIFVDLDEMGNCKATTCPPKGSVKKNGKLKWRIFVSDEAKDCLKTRKLMLKPKRGYASPLDPPEPTDDKLIKADALTPTRYEYEVWLVEANGTPVSRLEDPELEIIELH